MTRLVRVGDRAGHHRPPRRRPAPRRERHRPGRGGRRLYAEIEERSIFELMARQQPVATDLRMVVTALRMSADLERMGDLAEHVAKIARLRHPESAIPPELRATILEMGQIAERLIAKAGSVIATRDVDDGPGAGGRRRRDGPAAPQAVHACWPTTGARRRAGHGHHPDRPLLRAVRRPRGPRRPRVVYLVTGELPAARTSPREAGHGAVTSTGPSRSPRRRPPTGGPFCGRPDCPWPAVTYWPWLATASMAALAASGSRYSPPGLIGRKSSSSS